MENKDISKENLQRTERLPGRMAAGDDLGATSDLTEAARKTSIDGTPETSSAVERPSDLTASQGTEANREVTEGMQLGRYRIRSLLGEGGMGSVFLAYDEVLDRDLALKIPKFGATANPETLQRFHREARIAANVSHPNLCPVFDVGEIGGWQYIAMAYINGSPLSDYTSRDQINQQTGCRENYPEGCSRIAGSASKRNHAPRFETSEHHAGSPRGADRNGFWPRRPSATWQ